MDAWSSAEAVELIRSVYPELRKLAGCLLRGERTHHTLQRTALIHEFFLRLDRSVASAGLSQERFLEIAARQMRQILIDYGRRHRAQKRGGEWTRVEAALDLAIPQEQRKSGEALLALNQALDRLGAHDPRALAVVELKFFGGFTNVETAAIVGVSVATVDTIWQHSRLWLFRELKRTAVSPRPAFCQPLSESSQPA